MYLTHLAPGSTTSKLYTGRVSEHLGGRAPIVPVGNILGGGSSINFMMYTRASRSYVEIFNPLQLVLRNLIDFFKVIMTTGIWRVGRQMNCCHYSERYADSNPYSSRENVRNRLTIIDRDPPLREP